MKVIHILPTAFINNSDCQTSDTQLILAHLLKDKNYLEECKKYKGKLWLDNSFYEMKPNCYNVDDLIKLAKKVKAEVICLPDTTYITERQFYNEHKKMAWKVKRAGFKVMACVTCADSFETELQEFRILNIIDEIDIISIPYVFRENGDALRRWFFLDMIESKVGIKNLTKQYHLFGCNSYFNLRQEKRKWIQSIDMTMPFKEAYFGQPLPVSIEQENKRPKHYFDIKHLGEEKMDIVKYNIVIINEVCSNGNN